MLNAVRQVKERQIKEANEGTGGAEEVARIGGDSARRITQTREFMNAGELDQQSLMQHK